MVIVPAVPKAVPAPFLPGDLAPVCGGVGMTHTNKEVFV